MSTAHCRYRPAWELGGCCPGRGLDFPQLPRVLPQDAALAPEFVAAAEYSGSPGADLEGLLQQLEIVSGETLQPHHEPALVGGWGWGRVVAA